VSRDGAGNADVAGRTSSTTFITAKGVESHG